MTSFDVVSGAVVSVLRGEEAATQNVEAEVAAAFGPLVVLLGEHGLVATVTLNRSRFGGGRVPPAATAAGSRADASGPSRAQGGSRSPEQPWTQGNMAQAAARCGPGYSVDRPESTANPRLCTIRAAGPGRARTRSCSRGVPSRRR